MEAFFGTWKMDTCEGLDEVLVRLGVGKMDRQVAKHVHLKLVIAKKDDEHYHIVTHGGIKHSENVFKLDEAFKEKIYGGHQVDVSCTF